MIPERSVNDLSGVPGSVELPPEATDTIINYRIFSYKSCFETFSALFLHHKDKAEGADSHVDGNGRRGLCDVNLIKVYILFNL